jgi:tetratricopeptide (TPR) repeat protein
MNKKKIVFLVIYLLSTGYKAIYGQNGELEIQEYNDGRNLQHRGKSDQASVWFYANKDLCPLSFYAETDGTIIPVDTIDLGTEIRYLLELNTGNEYINTRVLEIRSRRCTNPLQFEDLHDIIPQEKRTYKIFVRECYKGKHTEGLDLIAHAQYDEARSVFAEARECYDRPWDGSVERIIADLDSIIYHKKQADFFFEVWEWKKAMTFYDKVLSYNAKDASVAEKRKTCVKNLNTEKDIYYDKADDYYRDHDYQKAKELYLIISKKYTKDDDTTQFWQTRLAEIAEKEENQRQHTTVFTIDYVFVPGYTWGLPIGFSIGGYKDLKGSAYFGIHTNAPFFNMLRKYKEKTVRPEFNISLGGDFRPIKPKKTKWVPVWINIGIGYTLAGAYYYKNEVGEDEIYKGGDLPQSIAENVTLYHAISPEIGLVIKISRFVLRYNFQYRFALDYKIQNYVVPMSHTVGIGFCW